ncbi:DNA methyltransferase [Erysipelothrix larvae]|uniref:site-specific DNA-methyltransferase (adenine-specific) n=1 Tax=Erysipelothrix larvae TaxID=1514105 RepID=A0A0X8H062_9FIRM|nr:DNA adenine methylase [Erysipelothrix larvae]AMC93638.1 DNA methyltransferase [Erysipelothrix larvae]
MKQTISPLRYPGGKFKIYDKVKKLIVENGLQDKTYVEPFAGGFAIGLALLVEGVVQNVILNDFDSHIYNFWYSVIHDTENFLKLLDETPVTIEERERQKSIYISEDTSVLDDGFATFYLNRVNYSGVISGGPMGGVSQKGKYKVDCRYNKVNIKNRIELIASFSENIELFNRDASDLIINELHQRIDTLFYNIDPPYVNKGHQLYKNYFMENDHVELKDVITQHLGDGQWIITYDDCELINLIYNRFIIIKYSIMHTAGRSSLGKEVVISNNANFLKNW